MIFTLYQPLDFIFLGSALADCCKGESGSHFPLPGYLLPKRTLQVRCRQKRAANQVKQRNSPPIPTLSIASVIPLQNPLRALHKTSKPGYLAVMGSQGETKQGRAFLRWAGGKAWLARQVERIFGGLSFARYHEPFLGGGAFFFSLGGNPAAYLSDKNDALIEVYQCLKNNHKLVITEMRQFKNTEEEYYRVRSEVPDCPYKRSARFIFLNQTSFNGLYRVNLKGVYNVPYGHRRKDFLDEESLELASRALRNSQLSSCDFMDALEFIGHGDLVFIDPPYTVSHNQNGFIKYNQALFSLEDQYRLAQFIIEVKRRGARYILTNAAHQKVREIFDLGDTCLELSRANLIGGKQAQRGAVKELLFTNLGVL